MTDRTKTVIEFLVVVGLLILLLTAGRDGASRDRVREAIEHNHKLKGKQ